MIYLSLSIICSTVNHLIFKGFERWNIGILSALVANYFMCILVGYASSHGEMRAITSFNQPWFYCAILQGALLIASFFFMSLTTQKSGVGIAALSSRLSIIIPTALAFFIYSDSLTFFKTIGIITAVIALYMSATNNNISPGEGAMTKFLPVILFILAGLNMTFAKYVQEFYLIGVNYHFYVTVSTGFSFISGLGVLTFFLYRGKMGVRGKDILAGMVLGVNNYGGIYFLIKAIGQEGWQSSVVFPTISVSVVIGSFLGGYVIFKEKIAQRKLISLGIGIIALVLINITV